MKFLILQCHLSSCLIRRYLPLVRLRMTAERRAISVAGARRAATFGEESTCVHVSGGVSIPLDGVSDDGAFSEDPLSRGRLDDCSSAVVW